MTDGILGGLSDFSGFKDLQNLGINPDTKEVTSYLLRAVSITGQATIQGAVRELVGGRFRDGFTQGMFQGLAAEIGRAINGDVAGRLQRGDITEGQARVERWGQALPLASSTFSQSHFFDCACRK